MQQTSSRIPVRAAFAFAGAGSLGTYLSGALRQLLIAIRAHNAALLEEAPDHDSRYLNAEWGRVTIDAIGGSSAGALCSSQLVRALFDPDYIGTGKSVAEPGTITGDWIHGGDFEKLSVEGNDAIRSGAVEAPGWTLISGAKLHDLSANALSGEVTAPDAASPLDPSGIVAVGITLTDLLGYHEPAEFLPDQVLGHPSFGAPHTTHAQVQSHAGMQVHDLGGRGHAEVRKLFLGATDSCMEVAQQFLEQTQRRGRARALRWSPEAAHRLATLTAASAALPVAVGPLALTDQAADIEAVYRRLYMDGGVLNNKPISPALKLARWHDGVRLLKIQDPDTAEFSTDDVERELVYQRVCFFVDAFPDRCRDEWRSVHPEDARRSTGMYALTNDAVAERNHRIDRALASPHAAVDTLFEAMMSSLRAQDMLGIAKTNHRLLQRNNYIDDRCARIPPNVTTNFRIDTVAKAHAYGSVLNRKASQNLTSQQRLAVAQRIWESDRFSGLGGRRSVTMIPVFAPDNLRAVFAGEALYALGGLLSYEARKHDAGVGTRVAQEVVKSLDPTADRPRNIVLSDAPSRVVPEDTAPVVRRLSVAGKAIIDGVQRRPSPMGFFAKLPLNWGPVTRTVKDWLDRRVRGMPEE